MFGIGRILESTSRTVATLAGLALLTFAAAPASAQTPVVFGATITDPGVYFLAGHQSGTGNGITIDSDDVVLLLTRFTLRGDGSGLGIASDGHDNVAIFGGRVTNFSNGISMSDGDYCTVQGTRIDHCRGAGVFLRRMEDSLFARLRADCNGAGVQAVNCYEIRLVSILAHDNDTDGITVGNELQGMSENENKVRLCWAAYNGRDGIRVLDAHHNDLDRNQCVGNEGAGIRLDVTRDEPKEEVTAGFDLTYANTLTRNWCVFNTDGIVVEWGATDNTMTQNTALANWHHDMVEHNDDVPCANTWFLNFFLTKGGSGEICIF